MLQRWGQQWIVSCLHTAHKNQPNHRQIIYALTSIRLKYPAGHELRLLHRHCRCRTFADNTADPYENENCKKSQYYDCETAFQAIFLRRGRLIFCEVIGAKTTNLRVGLHHFSTLRAFNGCGHENSPDNDVSFALPVNLHDAEPPINQVVVQVDT